MGYRSRDQRAVTPQHRGRYPGFDVLDSTSVWDDVTAGVVLGRLALPGAFAFFTPYEQSIAVPLLDLLLDQDSDPKIPVLGLIDARLAAGETDGWHYDDLPEDAQAWRDSLAALDRDADGHFAVSDAERQATLIQAVQDLASAGKAWHSWSAEHIWSLWTRYACTAFYSHPWAWNEIGFPGPAYPRGYTGLGVDTQDRWEPGNRDVDPVPFAQQVEQARHRHRELTGGPDEK